MMNKYTEPELKQAKGELERFTLVTGVEVKIVKAIMVGIDLIQQERDKLYEKRKNNES